MYVGWINVFCNLEKYIFFCYNKYMINEIKFKEQISKNLIYYRKMNKLTQSELANKLNYSDKAISKWERGENLPDLYILASIAELYGVSLNDLPSSKPSLPKTVKKQNHLMITLLSVGLVSATKFLANLCFFTIPKTTFPTNKTKASISITIKIM